MTLEIEVTNRISLGRSYIALKAPYYSHLLFNLTTAFVDMPYIAGVTDELVLYVNAAKLLEAVPTDEQMAGLLIHECEHILRGIERLNLLPNKRLANVAADIAINGDLLREGWELPETDLIPKNFGFPDGEMLEWYYDQLEQKGMATSSEMDGAGFDKALGKLMGKGNWKASPLNGKCGSIAGNPIDVELEKNLNAEYGRSAPEVEAVRRTTLEAIEQYAEQQGRGNIPGRFQELIKNKLKPSSVNWRQKLRRVYRKTQSQIRFGSADYSISRPSMVSSFTGAVMSGLVERPINVAVAIDTSGSMGTKQLEDAHNETLHLIRKSGVKNFWVIHADMHVHLMEYVSKSKLPNTYLGRGGTSFIPTFEAVEKLRPRPNLLVYLTDGDGWAPEKPPKGMEVIWCIVKTKYAAKPAKWGHLVVCDKNQKLRDYRR